MAQDKSTVYSDMLDIIFEDRNRAYGAYQLRRSYSKYLTRALIIGLLLIGLFMLLPLIINAVNKALEAARPPVEVDMTLSAPPDIDPSAPPPPPPPPPPTPPPPQRTTVQFTQFLLKKDDEVADDKPIDIPQDIPDTVSIGTKTVQGNTSDIILPPDDPSDLPTQVESRPVEEKVYETFDIQKMPSFPGGDAEREKFLRDNIKYPSIARENNIQGTVAVRFVVQKNGSITDIEVLKDPGGGLGKEAMRVVQMMPKWTPGEANGHPVKVKFTMPIRFRLE